MNPTPPPTPRGSSGPGTLLAGLAALAALVAFAAGQWTADRVAPSATVEGAAPIEQPVREVATTSPSRYQGSIRVEAPPPAPATAAPAEPLLTPQGRPTPTLVTRVAEDAKRGLEQARAELTERCVPTESRAGRAGSRFTFNVTFDAQGREIARGIVEDRRHRDPQVASCLRRLPLGSLRVPAPGTRVGVRVSMNL